MKHHTSLNSLWPAVGLLALIIGFFAITTDSHADEKSDAVATAVVYLSAQGNEATKTMALAAAGQSADASYLKDFSGNSAIEYAKPIMAIVAAKENPAVYPNEDFVAILKSFSDGTQLGSVSQINDDIWGILALRAAGVSTSDPVIQSSRAFVLGNQNTDGGWAWNVGGASDTNDTAGAIMALMETGMDSNHTVIQNAVAYIQSAQNDDGGFPYDPQSAFGTDSDGNSSAWVIAAANKLGQNAATWVTNGNNPIDYVLSLQDEDGGFWWMKPSADFNNKGPTADVIIALLGKSYPVVSLGGTDSDNGGTPSGASTEFRIVGSAGEICKESARVTDALEVVLRGAEVCGYTYDIQDTSFGKYVASINNDIAEGLKGWMYAVNGQIPDIGAADYNLSEGGQVVWFFGEFGAEPPAGGFDKVSDSVSLSAEIIDGTSDDGSGGQPGENPELAFSVHPASLDFGTLAAGSFADSQVVVKNEGTEGLRIDAEVQGDPVFNFLRLNTFVWSSFFETLSANSQEEINIRLAVPAGFNAFGQKQGSLIFWAESNK